MSVCRHILAVVALVLVSACDSGQSPQVSTQSGMSDQFLPQALWTSRNLTASNYQLVVSLNGQNHSFTLLDTVSNQYRLDLGEVPTGQHQLKIEIHYKLAESSSVLYRFDGDVAVSGVGQSQDFVIDNATLQWPDDDDDGRNNFYELDWPNIDQDGDTIPNYLDKDSDNDGANDGQDVSPYGTRVPELVTISEGCFEMGRGTSDLVSSAPPEETPLHQVCLPSFQVSKYEVTFAMYDEFTDSTARERIDDEGWGRGNRPVVNVSWQEANAYLQWLNEQTGRFYRLPSEAEWEYVHRAGRQTTYASGDDELSLCEFGNFRGAEWLGQLSANVIGPCGNDGALFTAPVGSFQPNAWGVYDMAGNAGEWVQDTWHESYQGAPTDGSAWEVDGQTSSRVVRLSSWNHYGSSVRAAARAFEGINSRRNTIGFRLVE